MALETFYEASEIGGEPSPTTRSCAPNLSGLGGGTMAWGGTGGCGALA